MAKDLIPQNSQVLIYQTEDGQVKIDVRFDGDTVWLTQKALAELFDVQRPAITKHLKNIFESGELKESAVCSILELTAKDGKKYSTKFYNLDAIISVGYRVNSIQATRFRQWATKHLKEFITKGFTMDDERLKNPDLPFDYFEELLERIQDIRTSERRFYQKVTDIYATSIDYDPTTDASILFFKTVQNKLHWAITGQTAAEIIHKRADSSLPNMGLTSWRGSKVRKADVGVAKNYLNQEELTALNSIVEAYLVFAASQARLRIPMHMSNWIETLDGFLKLSRREILNDAGRISHDLAMKHAENEYAKFRIADVHNRDDLLNDFDKIIELDADSYIRRSKC